MTPPGKFFPSAPLCNADESFIPPGILSGMTRGHLTQTRKDAARHGRNQMNFTEGNEGNEGREEFCQECAILGNSTAKAQSVYSFLASLRLCDFALKRLSYLCNPCNPWFNSFGCGWSRCAFSPLCGKVFSLHPLSFSL
jgi:hypothetical protein